ncbi:aspartate/glutamate racemase family protein [Neisseriaceae bacterium JH1-16]|nr:aspartate/glutamate racemase family protein [Neisseriaceae bacterium JH1-16]
MKTIGLIGGMSWESSALYYRFINEAVRRRLGGLHSAKVIINSIDFAPLAAWQAQGEWELAGELLAERARDLERAGADCIAIGANTMHKVADRVEAAVSVPLLHIGDALAAEVRRAGLRRVALLGTRFVMEQDFYRARLAEQGLVVAVPAASDRDVLHRIIFDELCRGEVREASRLWLQALMRQMSADGVEAVLLACTELVLLGEEGPVPVFDSARLHAEALVDWALS